MTAPTYPVALPTTPPPGVLRTGLRTVLHLTANELRLFRREPVVAVSLIGFPLATVLVLAGVFGDTPDPEFGGVSPSDHYLAGYIGVVLASLALITIPVHLAGNRELGVVRRFRASGVGAGALIATEILLGAVLATVAVAVVLATGAAVYGLAMPVDPLGVLGWYVAALACCIAIGVALGSLLSTGRAANALGNFIFVPMFLLGGGGPPRDVMPAGMQSVADVLPLTHLIGGLRQSWLGTTDDPHALWYPLAVGAAAVVVAVKAERRRAG